VFVSVARYEPFGLAVLEAAQAGCALVLADIPTFRELWGGVAVFVPPDDAGAIAASLEALADDEGARDRLGAAARIRARRYSVEAMADGVLAAYRTLGVGVEGEALGRATAA
jgi:glycosyltransferase involved in cell wall biosynthesis